MPRSFLIKKSSSKLINNSFSSNVNTSVQPNKCIDGEKNFNSIDDVDSRNILDFNYDGKGPYDLSIKSRPLKEANSAIRDDLSLEKAKDNNLIFTQSYANAQYRGAPLYLPPQSTKCVLPQDLSPRNHISDDHPKPAFTPLEPLNTNQRSPSSSPTIPRPLPISPYIPFGFASGCAGFGYNENRNLVTSPSAYYHHQTRHLEYPISPPQTPILRTERISSHIEENHHHQRTLSPEYRPQYLAIPWNDQMSLKTAISNGTFAMTSPTPSVNGSDNDSGRGSVHSRESGASAETKYNDSTKVNNRSPKSKKTSNGSESHAQRYQCADCNKSYSTFSGLSKHREFHCTSQAKKAFSCKHCDKVYVSLGALKMHIRTHTLPCKCKLCGKAFSRPWLLQGHIRTHTGEKPFACPHCSRAFADRSNLRAHLQTHSDVKKYSCKTCSKTFSRMSLLLKHEDGGCANNRIQ